MLRRLLRAWPIWVIPGLVMTLGAAAVADLYGAGESQGRQSTLPAVSEPVVTANTNASAGANAVLEYLRSLPSRAEDRFIAGQHAGDGLNASITPLSSVYGQTGHWPGLLSADYAFTRDFTRVNALAKGFWNEGGLVTISYHMPNVWTGGDFYDRTGIDIPRILTPGTIERERWLAELDFVAAALADLQEAGVVVLWRPLHEMNGSWFWWGGKLAGQFTALWRDMFAYLTTEKGLNNLLWVFSPSASQADPLPRYPGSEYVDVVGVDVYSNLESDCAPLPTYSELLTLGKPFAVTEFGPGRTEEDVQPYDWTELLGCIKSAHPQAVYFMVWSGRFGLNNDWHLNAEALLEDPWVINRSEVAWRPRPPAGLPEQPTAYTDEPVA